MHTDLRQRITERMDYLQECMESNVHLEKPQEILELMSNITKFWSVLSEEDQDYLHAARYAVEEQHEWRV